MMTTVRSSPHVRTAVLALAVAAATLAGQRQASAAQIYTNRDAYLQAIAGNLQPLVETFETAPLGLVPAAGISLPAVRVLPVLPNNSHLYIDAGSGALNVDGTKYVWADVRGAPPRFEFELVFAEPVWSFGANFFSARSASSLILRDQVNDVLANMATDWFGIGTGFFGFTLDSPITSVRFTPAFLNAQSVENFGMDNVIIGVVPEPASVGLALLGLGLGFRRR